MTAAAFHLHLAGGYALLAVGLLITAWMSVRVSKQLEQQR